MTSHPDSVQRLMQELRGLPGIGTRTAERLAQHILRQPREDALRLAEAIRDVKDRVRPCSRCFHMSDADPCPICADPRRETDRICVVEHPRDLTAVEETGAYRGLYHVLYGTLSPLDGVGPEDLTLEALLARVTRGGVAEVILATNPDIEGDGTSLYIQRMLAPTGVRVTRIASGVARGASLDRSSKGALAEALRRRSDASQG